MYLEKIKKIAADILFLDDTESIQSDVPFDKIGFTSIDFIDFCFEVKSQINPAIEPDLLWPFNKMLNDPALYVDGDWTPRGREITRDILGISDDTVVRPTDLANFWTPKFCSQRIESLTHG